MMSDRQLAVYLGVADHPEWPAAIARISPGRRACYERMANLEFEVELWLAGLGPRPTDVLIDLDEHRLVGDTLSREKEGIVARCACGWSSGGHFTSLAASAAFHDHLDEQQ